ncbi:MAG: phosphoribosylaminoimidazolesuccinocarboxamide synthase [Aerococcaceae bacterium]|nr:phosphoribosylaminoimidazolesuccinocarboxamide synthase [Aerococcaceae bacterium]
MIKLYEGKAKALYQTDKADELLVVYSNQATAFNGEKKADIEGKGVLNNQISALIFEWLNKQGIPTQLIRQVDSTSQLVKKLSMFPVEVVVRNRVAGSFAKRFGLEEGPALAQPVVELFYKADELGDPFVNTSQLEALDLLNRSEVEALEAFALRINALLVPLFEAIDMLLVDMKFEFGHHPEEGILLGDEISPDTCRFWDKHTLQKMDKDNFRRDLGSIIPVYEEVYRRLVAHINQ